MVKNNISNFIILSQNFSKMIFLKYIKLYKFKYYSSRQFKVADEDILSNGNSRRTDVNNSTKNIVNSNGKLTIFSIRMMLNKLYINYLQNFMYLL